MGSIPTLGSILLSQDIVDTSLGDQGSAVRVRAPRQPGKLSSGQEFPSTPGASPMWGLALVPGIIPSATVLGRSRHDWVMTHNEAVLEVRCPGRARERRGGRSARTERNAAPCARGSHVFGLRSESPLAPPATASIAAAARRVGVSSPLSRPMVAVRSARLRLSCDQVHPASTRVRSMTVGSRAVRL